MFKILFNIIINLMATIVQLVAWVPNRIISATLPDVNDKVTQVTNGISNLFSGFEWGLSLIPPLALNVLVFVVIVEIAKHTIQISTHALIVVWNLFQKIKFW